MKKNYNFLKTTLILFALFGLVIFGNAQAGKTISFANCGYDPNSVLTFLGTSGSPERNSYDNTTNKIKVVWNPSNTRWEIIAYTAGNFILYYSTTATYPNPPSFAYGAWVDAAGGCALATFSGSGTQIIMATVNITVTKTNVSCKGLSNGSATISVTGPFSPYTLSWSGSGSTASTRTGLSAGTYYVNVTANGGGPSTSQQVVISEPSAIALTGSQTKISDGSNGSATVVASGGTPSYTYSWTSSALVGHPTTPTISNLSQAGTYVVEVTDANSCTATKVFNIEVKVPGATNIDVANPPIGQSQFVVTEAQKYRIELWGKGATGGNGGGGAGGYSGKEVILEPGTYYYNYTGSILSFSNTPSNARQQISITPINMSVNNGAASNGGTATGGDQNINGGNGGSGGIYNTQQSGGGGGASGFWNISNSVDLSGATYLAGSNGTSSGTGGKGSTYAVVGGLSQSVPAQNGIDFGGGGGSDRFNQATGGSGGASRVLITEINCTDITSVTITGNASFCEGSSTTLTAAPSPVGASNVTYKWYKDEVLIESATTNTYTANQAGAYKVEASTECSSGTIVTKTDTKQIGVDEKPSFNTQPVSNIKCAGQSVSMTADANATSSYQWYKGSTLLQGETNTTLTISPIAVGNAGDYKLRATGLAGCSSAYTDSDIATLVVFAPVAITSSFSETASLCEGENITFQVLATGDYLEYKWYKNNVLINDATTNTLAITNATAADAAQYKVTVTGACGTPKTRIVGLSVAPKPVINNCPGDSGISKNTDAGVCGAIVNYSEVTVTSTSGTPVTSYTFTGATTASGAGTGSGSLFSVGYTTVTISSYIVTEGKTCNATTCSFTVDVRDMQAPVITCPVAQTVQTDAGKCTGSATFSMPVASDNCGLKAGYPILASKPDGSVINNFARKESKLNSVGTITISNLPLGLNTLVFEAQDAAGNSSTCILNITVEDNTPPVATYPANKTVNTDAGQCYATDVALGQPIIAPESCEPTVTNDAPTQFPKGDTFVNWTVTDAAGNESHGVQKITVLDKEKPAVTAGNQDVNLSADCKITVPDLTAVTDNCPFPLAGPTVSQSPAANTLVTPVNGIVTVTVSVTDASGNTNTKAIVLTAIDTTNPVLTASADQEVNLEADACKIKIPDVRGTATDNCPGTVITQSPAINALVDATHNSTIDVTVTATDALGNTSTAIVVLTAIDATNPTLTAAANQTVNLGADCKITIPDVKGSATDNCAGTVITQSPAAGDFVSSFHNGTIEIEVTATDAAGNTSTAIVIITAKDVSNPTLTAGSNQNVNLDNSCSITVPDVKGTATDNCEGTVIAQSPAVGSIIPSSHNSTINIIITATDAAGNTSTAVVVLTAKDVTAPATPTLSNITAECESSPNAPTTTDNCAVLITGTTSTEFPIKTQGTTIITWTFDDNHGNTTTATQNVIITDITAPNLVGVIPSGQTAMNICKSSAPVGPTAADIKALYIDNCNYSVINVVKSGTVTGTDCAWTVTYNYTIDDGHNNFATPVNITFSGGDKSAPSLTGTAFAESTPANGCKPNLAQATSTFSEVKALTGYTDNCAAILKATLTKTVVTGANNCSWTVAFTYSVEDACGNILPNQTYFYTGGDKTAPTLTGVLPSQTEVIATKANAPIAPTVSTIAALFTDTCDSPTATLISQQITGDDCGWNAIYEYVVTDACNNTTTATVTYSGAKCTDITLSGKVVKNTESGTGIDGTVAPGIYITLVKKNSTLVEQVVQVSNTGTYTFAAIEPGNYTLVMGISSAGSANATPPAGYTFGTETGIGAIGDGNNDGKVNVLVTSTSITYSAAKNNAAVYGNITFALLPISGPLPVQLISFTGKSTENGNELTWKTSSEKNFSHFEVERSNDANNFEKIGKVEANHGEIYEFLDSKQTTNYNPQTYYRLKMIDLDGASAYSKIVYIKIENQKSTVGQFYPNPTIGDAKVNVSANESGNWTLKTFDIQGKLIGSQTQYLQKGENIIEIKSLSKGMNYIQLSDGTKTEIRKVLNH